ncbi:hypothetical protein Pcinc_042465 [Petrolisthes cinctipes]|uniref:Aromatic amino acid beta-eliminating lyase/threonine aldolase domain-containing protein n=1 Tax=Petrolisthes cinctipes TaxID=88211 RepID=A0AAE1BHF6_PETCI|nr:hypothetical protein Pcinc_042465 [Petrolisthes cinctipes]
MADLAGETMNGGGGGGGEIKVGVGGKTRVGEEGGVGVGAKIRVGEEGRVGVGGKTRVVDLRSDTLTYPSLGMKTAMMEAILGDDVLGEDPTVNALQERVARLLGKESAAFLPSGTMCNLIAVLLHCDRRGGEVLVGDNCHIYRWEQGGIAQFGGVHSKSLKTHPDGTFSLTELRQAVRADNIHFPRPSLVCVENTHNMEGGKVLPLSWLDELSVTCRELGLPLHMDGARLLNASVSLGVSPERIVRDFDSVTICLSKGLGAPVGSVLVSSAAFIERAKRLRKGLGGGMRQSGVLAAAGLYALQHIYPRLSEDHKHVQIIAKAVNECVGGAVTCDPSGAHTNILMLTCDPARITPAQFCTRMEKVGEGEEAALGERVSCRLISINDTTVRLVTYKDISLDDVEALVKKLVYVIKGIA